jgi:hypothetical protein
MKTIKIISGIYGYRPAGSKVIEPKRAGDPAFQVEDAEAARLVSLKVAAYVDVANESIPAGVATAPEQSTKDEPSNNIPEDTDGFKDKIEAPSEIPSYSVDMKSTELREIMSDYGIPYKVGMSKADMVAALDEYFKEESGEDSDEGSEGDGEAPPDLEAEEPVL